MRNGIYGFSGPYEFLSNFYPSKITVSFNDEIIEFPDVEHAFQFLKANSDEWRKKIWEAPTPGKAKLFGRQCDMRPNWDKTKDHIMKYLVREKFKQNPDLRNKLLATNDLYLEETNTWKDIYWGVYNGKGENRLGYILMECRKELANK